MAIPSKTKTWQYSVNQQVLATGTNSGTAAKLLRGIKNSLIGFGLAPWATTYSCDGVTAGTAGDGVDRWATDNNIVWNTSGAHSWYVLRQTGIATNFELCLDCLYSSATTMNMTIAISPSTGFSGGTTSARPTSADEIVLVSDGYWGVYSQGATSDSNHRYHVMQSTDGAITRIIIYTSGAATGFWDFEKPAISVTGWTNPSVSTVLGSNNGTAVITATNLYSTANAKGKGASEMSMFYTCESRNNVGIFSVLNSRNDISLEYPILPIGLESDTVSNKGRHGRLADIFYGLSIIPDGFVYPSDGTNQFVQFGNLIFPWNGSMPHIY